MHDLYGLARRGSYYMLAGKLITPAIGFIITIIVIRSLSVKDYGIYNILLAVLSYIGLFSSLGFPSIFQRYLPEFWEKKQITFFKKLVMKGLLWRFVLAAALVMTIILLFSYLERIVHIKGYLDYFSIFSIAIIFALEVQLLRITLTSLFMHREVVIAQLIYTLFRGVILYLLLLQLGAGLIGLLVAEGLSYGLQFFLQAFYYRRFSCSHPTKAREELPWRRLLRFGGYSYFNEMGSEILSVSTDIFIIAAFLGPQFVGLYAFANRLMTMMMRILPHELFMDVIRPTFFTRYAQSGEKKDLVRMFNLIMKLVAFISFPLMVGVFVLGDKLIIYLFDPKYLNALPVLWIVAFFTALNSFQFPLGLVTQSIERVEINFYSKIFAVYNLVLDLIVVKYWGILGIAIVTCTAILFKNLFVYVLTRKYIQFSVDWKALGTIASNSILMACVIFPFKHFITNIYSFLMITSLGGIFYVLVASFNKGFSTEEKAIMNKILPRPVFIF